MNRLAELHKTLMSKEGSPEYEKFEQDFLSKYFSLRKKEEKKFYNRLSLKQRLKIYPFLLSLYKLKNKIGGFTNEVIFDKKAPTNKPIIFAVTHIGKFDIEIITETLSQHYFLLSGDFEHLQGTFDSPFLGLNGVFYFNEKVKFDRRDVSKRMVKVLKQGGNIMYFPEGTWNLHPCLPMLPCYWGIIDIARRGNAEIVPIAVEQYGKHFKVNIGKNIDITESSAASALGKEKAIQNLRDTLAALKWEIWETEHINRKDITNSFWEDYITARLKEWPYFTVKYINGLIYQPKGITSCAEAFEHLNHLIPCRENAFLLRKEV